MLGNSAQLKDTDFKSVQKANHVGTASGLSQQNTGSQISAAVRFMAARARSDAYLQDVLEDVLQEEPRDNTQDMLVKLCNKTAQKPVHFRQVIDLESQRTLTHQDAIQIIGLIAADKFRDLSQIPTNLEKITSDLSWIDRSQFEANVINKSTDADSVRTQENRFPCQNPQDTNQKCGSPTQNQRDIEADWTFQLEVPKEYSFDNGPTHRGSVRHSQPLSTSGENQAVITDAKSLVHHQVEHPVCRSISPKISRDYWSTKPHSVVASDVGYNNLRHFTSISKKRTSFVRGTFTEAVEHVQNQKRLLNDSLLSLQSQLRIGSIPDQEHPSDLELEFYQVALQPIGMTGGFSKEVNCSGFDLPDLPTITPLATSMTQNWANLLPAGSHPGTGRHLRQGGFQPVVQAPVSLADLSSLEQSGENSLCERESEVPLSSRYTSDKALRVRPSLLPKQDVKSLHW